MKKNKTLPLKIFLPIYIAVIVAVVVLDQLSKHFVYIATESGTKDIPIIGDFLALHWTINQGATGGMFNNLGWQNWLFFFITLIGIPLFVWLLLRSRTRSVVGQVAFAFITGGTIGNAIDRFIFGFEEHVFFGGGVRDFIYVKNFFGISNLADNFLVLGVILALLAIIFFDPDSLLRVIIEERASKKRQASESQQEDDQSQEQAQQEQQADDQPQQNDDSVQDENN